MLGALSTQGLVFKNRHGRYSFAVPLLGKFITRQGLVTRSASWGWRKNKMGLCHIKWFFIMTPELPAPSFPHVFSGNLLPDEWIPAKNMQE